MVGLGGDSSLRSGFYAVDLMKSVIRSSQPAIVKAPILFESLLSKSSKRSPGNYWLNTIVTSRNTASFTSA